MSRKIMLLLALAIAPMLVVGCGGQSVGEADPNPEQTYAETLKSDLLWALHEAKRNPAEVDYLAELFESLDQEMLGPYADTVQSIQSGIGELATLPASARTRKLDELIALADSLPGDFEVE